MKKPPTSAIDVLEQQHGHISKLFWGLTKVVPHQRPGLLLELADLLAVHATIEEKIFYPAVLARHTEDLLLESLEEHLGIKRILTDLLALEAGDDTFDAKIKVLRDQVEHHVGEERKDLFPRVKELFDAAQLEALGRKLLAMTAELRLAGAPRARLAAETAEPATL